MTERVTGPGHLSRLPAPELPSWLTAGMPACDRYRIAVGDQQMHVMERGAGRPVLLLHGNPTWGYLYRRVAAALEGDPLRLVMPDLVGLGLSTKPRRPGEHTMARHVAWTAGLLRSLDLAAPIFVGQDWGGPIGLAALAAAGIEPAGMVILNTVLGPPREGFRPTAFHRFSRLPLVSTLVFRGCGFPQGFLGMAQGDAASVRGVVGRAYRWPLGGWRRRAAPLGMARMVPDSLSHPSIPLLADLEASVRRFAGPAAIVWGDRDPILGRVKRRIAGLLPQATVTDTAAGHFLQEEVPEAIADAVREVAAAIDR